MSAIWESANWTRQFGIRQTGNWQFGILQTGNQQFGILQTGNRQFGMLPSVTICRFMGILFLLYMICHANKCRSPCRQTKKKYKRFEDTKGVIRSRKIKGQKTQ